MSIRRSDPTPASSTRLEHVLNVGMVEVGAKAEPVTHWMDTRNTPKKLADMFKKDLERKVPESKFKALSVPPKAGDPLPKISVTLDIGLLITATITVPNTFEIMVTVTGEDYTGASVTETSTYSALPTTIQYRTFVDVVMSSITVSLAKLSERAKASVPPPLKRS